MSKQPVRGIETETLEEDKIAHYLQLNPEFF